MILHHMHGFKSQVRILVYSLYFLYDAIKPLINTHLILNPWPVLKRKRNENDLYYTLNITVFWDYYCYLKLFLLVQSIFQYFPATKQKRCNFNDDISARRLQCKIMQDKMKGAGHKR